MQYLDLNTLNLDIHIFIEVLAIIIALVAITESFIIKFKVIPKLRENIANPNDFSDIKEQITTLTNKLQEIEDNTPKYIEISDTELVEIYNNYPDSLLNPVEVSETPESYEHHNQSNNHPIVLKKVDIGGGYYWVLIGKDSSYLVPKKGIKI